MMNLKNIPGSYAQLNANFHHFKWKHSKVKSPSISKSKKVPFGYLIDQFLDQEEISIWFQYNMKSYYKNYKFIHFQNTAQETV